MMIAEIELERETLKEILESTYEVIKITKDDRSVELNIKFDKNLITFYSLAKGGLALVIHELKKRSLSDVYKIHRSTSISFNPNTLMNIINKTNAKNIRIIFNEYACEVFCKLDAKHFSSPLVFKLHLYAEQVHQRIPTITGLEFVTKVSRDDLQNILDTLSAISTFVNFEINNGTLWIISEDKVEGLGKIKKDLSEDCKIRNVSYFYRLGPIAKFISKTTGEIVEIRMNIKGYLELRIENERKISKLILPPTTP